MESGIAHRSTTVMITLSMAHLFKSFRNISLQNKLANNPDIKPTP